MYFYFLESSSHLLLTTLVVDILMMKDCNCKEWFKMTFYQHTTQCSLATCSNSPSVSTSYTCIMKDFKRIVFVHHLFNVTYNLI